MKLILLVSVLAVLGLGVTAQAQSRKVFPYNYTIDDLPNGLRLIVIPTDYPESGFGLYRRAGGLAQ